MQKTFTTTITVGVTDEGDTDGSRSIIYLPPGSEVTLDADEADRIIERHGGEVLAVLPDEPSR